MTLELDTIAVIPGVSGVFILMGLGGAFVSLWGDPKRNLKTCQNSHCFSCE